MKTSIDIAFPEIEELLNPWRKNTIELSQKGVPPHISIVFPWIDAPIEDIDIKNIVNELRNVNVFSLEFISVEKFDNGVVYFGVQNSIELHKI